VPPAQPQHPTQVWAAAPAVQWPPLADLNDKADGDPDPEKTHKVVDWRNRPDADSDTDEIRNGIRNPWSAPPANS